MIWLNGTFGAGKTATAYLLQSRLPHASVFDPENAGFYLRQNLPEELDVYKRQVRPFAPRRSISTFRPPPSTVGVPLAAPVSLLFSRACVTLK